ncbi:hypothetical protein Taro_015864, partial [Colocasia esculenta]|nr:hypothetical protein [Colocasia esculenta]
EFNRCVSEGFQVTPIWHQGFLRDDGRSNYVQTVKTARWEYSTRPVYGWGDVNSKQKSSAGWLAAFPVFEPHWQICMAGGLSTGWIEWDGERFEFENAPSYSEKNWGEGFPRKWFWVQCNVFEGGSGEIALTAGGGLRKLPGLSDIYESVALVGVHFGGTFYEFVPWNGTLSWEISLWGCWKISAENKSFVVELEATTEDPGTPLRAPTTEAGLVTACKDTCFADLRLKLWERRYDGNKGKLILDVTSNMAAVEVGGGPWYSAWKATSTSPELIRQAVGLPIDVEGLPTERTRAAGATKSNALAVARASTSQGPHNGGDGEGSSPWRGGERTRERERGIAGERDERPGGRRRWEEGETDGATDAATPHQALALALVAYGGPQHVDVLLGGQTAATLLERLTATRVVTVIKYVGVLLPRTGSGPMVQAFDLGYHPNNSADFKDKMAIGVKNDIIRKPRLRGVLTLLQRVQHPGAAVVPFFAMAFFGDKIDSEKVMAMQLGIWGFASYIYLPALPRRQEAQEGGEGHQRSPSTMKRHGPIVSFAGEASLKVPVR